MKTPQAFQKLTQVLFTVGALAASIPAHATIVASLGSANLSADVRTHVVIIGKGKDMERMFAQSAVAKAKRLKDFEPSSQVVIISVNENHDSSDRRFFENVGASLIRYDQNTFTGATAVREMLRFNQIASIEIFSHSGWSVGTGMEGGDYRFTQDTEGADQLRGHFTADAYGWIFGCNSGFILAPELSKLWGIPVAGSYTSTDLQQLHNNGLWYHNNPGQAPRGGWASTNTVSYSSAQSCYPGDICFRMKPDNANYSGVWGSFPTGLGFYKFNCANGENSACLKGIRQAMLSSVSILPLTQNSTIEAYKTVAKDWLCPGDVGDDRQGCFNNLELAAQGQIASTYTPYGSSNSLSCTLEGCLFDSDDVPTNSVSRRSTAIVDEYKLYLRAFNAR